MDTASDSDRNMETENKDGEQEPQALVNRVLPAEPSQPSVSPAVEPTVPGNELALPVADPESSVLDLAVFVNARYRCGENCRRRLEIPCQASNDVPHAKIHARAQARSLAREGPTPDGGRVRNRPRRQVCALCEEVGNGVDLWIDNDLHHGTKLILAITVGDQPKVRPDGLSDREARDAC